MNETALLRAHGIEPATITSNAEHTGEPDHPYTEPAVLAELVVHVIDVHGRVLWPGAINRDRLEGLHAQLHRLGHDR